MKKTIPVVDRVDSLIALMVENSSRFVAIPIRIAPAAPIPAASVGVAYPKIIDPKTANMSKRGGAKEANSEKTLNF